MRKNEWERDKEWERERERDSVWERKNEWMKERRRKIKKHRHWSLQVKYGLVIVDITWQTMLTPRAGILTKTSVCIKGEQYGTELSWTRLNWTTQWLSVFAT